MLLIDAFNVLHAAIEVDPRFGGLTLEGLAHLLASSRHGSLPCVLVCDGTGAGKAQRINPSGVLAGNVRAQFAGPGLDADSAIERLLEDQERKRAAHRCTVVSSDKRVKAAAAGVRAKWMSSRTLLEQLIEDAERAMKKADDRTGRKPERVVSAGADGLDADSAAYWLSAFGYAPGVPAKPVSKPSATTGKGQPPIDDTARLVEEARQEWGDAIAPDDLNMEKWLKGAQPPKRRTDEE